MGHIVFYSLFYLLPFTLASPKRHPPPATWASFNNSISGRLISSHPTAYPCHTPNFNQEACSEVTKNWSDSFWRTDQVGGYSAILWEAGDGACWIDGGNTTVADRKSGRCEGRDGNGLVADYTVDARNVGDIQKAVVFADRWGLDLRVKNTGHDHLGRSSGKGTFAIWTHNLKGRKWHDGFLPKGAPKGTLSLPAVTLQAGEQWFDVYKDATTQKRIVVGGSARTVGAAGGYLTGGGHSAWSNSYGLAVDNLLEVTLITAQGKHKTINAYNDPEHFYAIRGGGGSSWGVITSATYKTHPEPSHIQVAFAQFNVTKPEAFRGLLMSTFRTLPSVTDGGYTGYGTTYGGFGVGLIFIKPNGTNESFVEAFQPLFKMTELAGVQGAVGAVDFPSWDEYTKAFLQDPNIATNVIDTSRLLTKEVLEGKADELVRLTGEFPEFHAGFNFIGKVNSAGRDDTAVHEAWKTSRAIFSLGIDWPNDTPTEEKKRLKRRTQEVSRRFTEIVGKEGGTYVNEANPFEPDWKQVFWGGKYDRLLRIKKRVDPKGLFRCNRCVGGEVVWEP
ncbi:FAD binding domain-containing protein [Ascobolus immersus RN42]|uniref:FAD binding domain-containing protein n=1 Tax=Ascobolus immersus RN42 TaxID=1160509 RepID=A0A3N4I5D3_ASCIM|nr:FAD binding domain-containing protein [Ascobolus immersus RN42]